MFVVIDAGNRSWNSKLLLFTFQIKLTLLFLFPSQTDCGDYVVCGRIRQRSAIVQQNGAALCPGLRAALQAGTLRYAMFFSFIAVLNSKLFLGG